MKTITVTLAAVLLAASLTAPVQAAPFDMPDEFEGSIRCFPYLC